MIRKILTYYAGRLDEYLGRTHRQPEGVATVGLIGTAAEETPNSVLSDTLEFIQSMPRFETEGHRYTVELVPMSTMDLHNIWTTMGGQYHPSVICKVRGLVIDSGTLVSGSTAAQDGTPESCTLVFHAPEHRWEYLLETHTDGKYGTEDLLIEEYGGKLTAGGNTSRRRVLLKSLPLLQAGAYLDAASGLLSQVCRL